MLVAAMHTIVAISSLLAGIGILLIGSGLIGLLLVLRAVHEQFGDLTIGLVMSAFFLGYVAGAWICPPLVRRVGHARAFAAFAAASAVVSLAYGLWVEPLAWAGLRLLNGISLFGVYMVIESWLSERSQTARSQIFATYMMVSLLAVGVGQYLILPYGALDMASFALVAILFCLGLIPIALTPVREPVPIEVPTLRLSRLYTVAPVGAAAALVSGLVIGCFWALAAVYARSRGLQEAGIANFTAAAIFGGAVLQWPIGRASDAGDRRWVLIAVCAGAAIALTGMGFVAPDRHAFNGIIAFVFGGFAFSVYGLAVAQTHDRFQSSESLEATKALLLLYGVGATTGPVLAGAAMQLIATEVFPLILAIMLIGLAVYTYQRIRRQPPVAPANQAPFVPVHRTTPVVMDMDPRGGGDQGPLAPPAPPTGA
jgi:MFS family permease